MVNSASLEAYQVVLQRVWPDVILDDLPELICASVSMISEPSEEALWLFMLPLPSCFILCLTGALGQVLTTQTRKTKTHKPNCDTGRGLVALRMTSSLVYFADNSERHIPFLISIWFLLTLKMGRRSRSDGTLWKVLYFRSRDFRRNTGRTHIQVRKQNRKTRISILFVCGVKTHKIYSVAWLDVFKLCHLHPAQVMKRLFIFLTQ